MLGQRAEMHDPVEKVGKGKRYGHVKGRRAILHTGRRHLAYTSFSIFVSKLP